MPLEANTSCATVEWREWRLYTRLSYAKAILAGFRNQLKHDGVVFDGIVGMHEMPDMSRLVGPSSQVIAHPSDGGQLVGKVGGLVRGLVDDAQGDGAQGHRFGVISGYWNGATVVDEHVAVDGHVLKFDSGEGPFFDDLTGQELPTALVKAARRK